ncbi:hypothetical protein C5167_005969 [Papaver somniferum]|uniref:Uncharacterized protein n=1 Tax=Papaver somniferum TaxID=3469 RepID=A0A4Y7JF43_PAPSO|nr:hypothetical protein C5167_005969 [Papaver somniferum]
MLVEPRREEKRKKVSISHSTDASRSVLQDSYIYGGTAAYNQEEEADDSLNSCGRSSYSCILKVSCAASTFEEVDEVLQLDMARVES